MTVTIATDSINDIYVGADGNLALASGLQAALQDAEHAAKTLRGEMVLAVDQGIPYFQVVWSGVPNVSAFEAAMRQALLAVPDVLEVVSLSTVRLGATLAYEAVIRTIYGIGSING